jgi:hypothetical protein
MVWTSQKDSCRNRYFQFVARYRRFLWAPSNRFNPFWQCCYIVASNVIIDTYTWCYYQTLLLAAHRRANVVERSHKNKLEWDCKAQSKSLLWRWITNEKFGKNIRTARPHDASLLPISSCFTLSPTTKLNTGRKHASQDTKEGRNSAALSIYSWRVWKMEQSHWWCQHATKGNFWNLPCKDRPEFKAPPARKTSY